MKIIIPVEGKNTDAPVCPSFGRTPFFMLFDTETQKSDFIDNAAANSQGGAGIKAAQTLVDSGAKILITYRCGQNAADVLNAGGIQIYKAEPGSANDNIQKYKEEKLAILTDIHPGFHNHGGAN